jgi:hypothetical protein
VTTAWDNSKFARVVPEGLLNPLRRLKAVALRTPDRLLQRWAQREVLRRTKCVVASGPFAGMRFTERHVFGAPMAKLLGTYEMELRKIVEGFLGVEFDGIVNIGAGEGYYAVGLASRIPSLRVVAYESLESGRKLIQEVADKNGMRDRLELRGMCSRAALESLLEHGKRYLIVADVEGAEVELFHPSVVALLSASTLLVETHDFIVSGCTEELRERFRRTHVVIPVQSEERSLDDFPLPLLLPVKSKLWLMNEGRPTQHGPMTWLVMSPRPGNELVLR